MRILKELWGTYHTKEVYLYTMISSRGSTVKLTNYGARVVAIRVPDKAGCLDDVVLGFDSLAAYVEDDNYIGATIGRFANRISKGSFSLDGQSWVLDANDGTNTNHSGVVGFDHQVFEVTQTNAESQLKGSECKINNDESVVFYLVDPHNNGGFPGNLRLKITYRWAENPDLDQLCITYEACSDRKSILNLTNHSYFNLSGTSHGTQRSSGCSCLWHKLEIAADSLLETGPGYIPTGRKIAVGKNEVTGLLRDVCAAVNRKAERVMAQLSELEPTVVGPGDATLSAENAGVAFCGLNTCFELNPTVKPLACRLSCDNTGRELLIETSYPGLIVYTGDNLHGRSCGYLGRPYAPFDGVALECQYYPDSPNQPEFPPAIIGPDQPYLESITYSFSIRKTEDQT